MTIWAKCGLLIVTIWAKFGFLKTVFVKTTIKIGVSSDFLKNARAIFNNYYLGQVGYSLGHQLGPDNNHQLGPDNDV